MLEFSNHAPLGTWWQVRNYTLNERIAPGERWWLNNRHRQPAGIALFQCTLAGRMFYRDSQGMREVPAGWAMLCLSGDDIGYGFTPEVREDLETRWMSFSGAGLAEHWND